MKQKKVAKLYILGEKFAQNFISSKGGPVKVLKQCRDENTQIDCHGKMEEKKDHKATLHLLHIEKMVKEKDKTTLQLLHIEQL